jgi:hypothetical protein
MYSTRSCLFLLFYGLLCLSAQAQKKTAAASREEWISLFNGKDLKGWDIKITGYDVNVNHGNTFRVENGLMRVVYDQYSKFTNEFGHIYYQKPYSHYKLRVEYRFVGIQIQGGPSWDVRNSGVMVHSQSAKSLAKDQEFPVSLEMQFLGGLGDGPRTTGNLCTPGTYVEMADTITMAHCINSSSRTYDGDQWVMAEMEVYGDSLIRHSINGQVVLTYTHPKIGEKGDDIKRYISDEWAKKQGTLLGEGYIALQAESAPIDFRKVELLNLKGCMNPKCPHYKSYFVVPDKCTCKP